MLREIRLLATRNKIHNINTILMGRITILDKLEPYRNKTKNELMIKSTNDDIFSLRPRYLFVREKR